MIGPEIALPPNLPNRVRENFLTIVFNHEHSHLSSLVPGAESTEQSAIGGAALGAR